MVFIFSMKLRPVAPQDIPIISAWWNDRQPQAVRELINRATKLYERKRGAGYVAVCGNVPCGFALLTYWVNVAEISDLLVIPAYRGQGIGTQILETLLGYARSAGYANVEIGVLASNSRARQLYERVGFVPVRTIQHRFTHGYEDIIFLLCSTQ